MQRTTALPTTPAGKGSASTDRRNAASTASKTARTRSGTGPTQSVRVKSKKYPPPFSCGKMSKMIVFPDEVHEYLVFDHWRTALNATDDFFKRHLRARASNQN